MKQLLLFVIALLPMMVSANDLSDNGIYYQIKSDGSLEVTGLASGTTVADIPSSITINGSKYRVTSIGAYAFDGRSDITYLSIPYSIKTIGEYAFRGCGSSMTVNIADPESWCQMQLGNEHASPLSSAGKLLVHDIETTSIDIPETVTSISAFTFYQCSCLTSVNIPGTVTSIGSSAFEDCDYLTSLTLNEGLQSIGGSAFEGCKRLANLVLPSTVNSILMNAFKNCVGLTDVYCFAANVPSTDASAFTGVATENVMLHVPDNAINAYKSTWPWSYFKGSIDMSKSRTIYVGVAGTLSNYIPTEEIQYVEELTLTGYLNGTDIGFIRRMAGAPLNYDWTWGGTYEEAERGQVYGRLAVLDISDATIVAGGDYYYNGWADIDLEHEYHRVDEYSTSNNTISKHMFEDCKFTKVFLPNNIMKIESAAFDNCESLTRIDIPQSVTSFSACLSGCSSLTSIKVESGNQTYDSRNDCNAIIKKSSNTLIEGCNNTIIPNTVISIGDYAFFGCKGLTSINIPNSVTSIGNYAFYQCSGLASVTIPNSVTSIGDGAFYSCSNLASIEIPGSVTSIGGYTFYNCSGLTSVVSDIKNPFKIENSVFDGIPSYAQLIVPEGTKAKYQTLSGWNTISRIIEVGGVGYAFEADGIYYIIGENCTAYVTDGNINYSGDVVIPNQVTYLGTTYRVTNILGFAFCQCSELTSIYIPNSVTSIEGSAFSGCSNLTSITLPPSMDYINENAFNNCNNLTAVYISDLKAFLNISFWMGDYPSNPLYYAHHLFLNGKEISDLIIPNGITSIRDYALINCSSIKSVYIPNGVTSIGICAFIGCSSLTAIYCNNTVPPSCSYSFSNKEKCVVWVPKGSINAYKEANEWKDFKNIKEIMDGDVNLDGKVNKDDVDALVAYIMGENSEMVKEYMIDVNRDGKVNIADVTRVISITQSEAKP